MTAPILQFEWLEAAPAEELAKYLIWDFDNTLAIRAGPWSECLAQVVNHAHPHKVALREAFRPHLSSGFPWHDPEQPHAHLSSPDEWWAALAPTLQQALRLGAALAPEQVSALLPEVRSAYLDPRAWMVFDDTVAALELLAGEGWRQVILSNHVPELPQLVAALGLSGYFTAIHNSGTTGFEKPHPRTYAAVLETFGPAPRRVVMVGDNYVADYVGPRAAGIEAVLVRTSNPQCAHFFPTVLEAAQFIIGRS